MTTTSTKKTNGSTKVSARRQPPRSLAIANAGIVTGRDFAGFISALMSDLIDGRVSPNIGNATCNAGAKLLKVAVFWGCTFHVEMSIHYGTPSASDGKMILLAPRVSE